MSRAWLRRFALDRPEARAWAMYDWANSAFMTTVITAVFPIYFLKIAGGLGEDLAQKRFSQATTAALVLSALMAPLLGTIADFRALKKTLLGAFVLLGSVSTAALFFALPGDWVFALTCFGIANVCAAASVTFYDALLPHVALGDEVDRLSTSGYALGYVGGGTCLALNLLWIKKPEWFGLPFGEGLSPQDATLPVRLALLSVGVWWMVFTIPLLRKVKEPARMFEPDESEGSSVLVVSLQRLRETFSELRRYRQAFLMLAAFMLYNDGIATIIRMAAIYASSKQLGDGVVIGTILAVQFIGIPCAFAFGRLSTHFETKRLILFGVAVYCGISILAFFMNHWTHFVLLGVLVALVQGGTQALSRSLFASLIPQYKSGEFFAFFGVFEKFAGILGPALYVMCIDLTGSTQGAILSVIPFFVIGGTLLLRVDVVEGRRVARAAEAEVRAVR